MQKLQETCNKYCEKNNNIAILQTSDLEQLWSSDDGKLDIGVQLKAVLNTLYRQRDYRRAARESCADKVVDFCVKLYPLSSFCFRLLAPAAEVFSNGKLVNSLREEGYYLSRERRSA
jgi:hypothetical protein